MHAKYSNLLLLFHIKVNRDDRVNFVKYPFDTVGYFYVTGHSMCETIKMVTWHLFVTYSRS